MSPVRALLILVAGIAAGTINTVVGSGTLITFPVLLFLGYPPVVANVSNTIGLVAGGVTAVHGYRDELRGSARTLRRLAPASLAGGVLGAVLLLVLPPAAFQAIVPVLIALGLVLVVVGPRVQRRSAQRHEAGIPPAAWHGAALTVGVLVAGIYGGYFGAAQGVILMGLLSALSSEPIQRLNAYKNVLATIVNAVAALTFMAVAWGRINWLVAALVGVGAFIGGLVGSRVGRRLPPWALRTVIIVVGLVGITKIVWFS